MQTTKEDGHLWFNNACKSGRIATAIKENNNNSVLYMYIGGGAVDHHQSHLLGGVVVSCKDWRWAAFIYVAMRIVGRVCNKALGRLKSALVISKDSQNGELTMAIRDALHKLCNDTWDRVNTQCCHDMLVDHTKQKRFELDHRQQQAEAVGNQLAMQKREHEADAGSP